MGLLGDAKKAGVTHLKGAIEPESNKALLLRCGFLSPLCPAFLHHFG